MAQFPCSVGDHRYMGKQLTMYPAVLLRSSSQRRMLRLCSSHFEEFHEQLQASAQLTNDQDLAEVTNKCALCLTEVHGQSGSFFVTVYNTANEREDWYGPVHEDCADALAEDWLLPPRMP